MNAAWLDAITRSRLSSTERWVLVAWLRRVGDLGNGVVGVRELASDTGFGERTVRRSLAELRRSRVLRDLGRSPSGRLRLRMDPTALR